MAHETAEDAHSSVLDVEVGVLHAVEEHEKVLVARDERVELRVQVLEHGHTDPVIVVGCRGHEELVQELIDDANHDSTESLELLGPLTSATLVMGEGEGAAGLYGILPHSRVLVV